MLRYDVLLHVCTHLYEYFDVAEYILLLSIHLRLNNSFLTFCSLSRIGEFKNSVIRVLLGTKYFGRHFSDTSKQINVNQALTSSQ
jgi:hypothetical protein